MSAFTHKFNPVILREYDIRGTVGSDLVADDAYALGRVFGTRVRRSGGSNVAVAYDGRTHSPMLESALIRGLVDSGINVVRLGLGPTPMLYFGVHHLQLDAGIMVTGSHNPPEQNGFKMLLAKHLRDGGPFYGKAITALATAAEQGDVETGQGNITDKDIRDSYIARLAEDCKGKKPLRVVWDNGNGAAGDVLQELVELLPGEHKLLYQDIDGKFPNHHPDPTVAENLRDLIAAVSAGGYDLGIAFDGDADRIGAVDGMGRILAGDQLLALYARDVLQNHPRATIIADVKASQELFDDVAAHNGVPLMWKTGHSLVKVKMAETKSPLAGEMSGHIFFADHWYGFDDALYAGVRLIDMVSRSGKSLAQLRDSLQLALNTPEIRIPVAEIRKFAIIDEIKARIAGQGADVNDVDGVRVKTQNGWWLIRASNTQAVLVARAESKSEKGLEELKNAIIAELKASHVDIPPSLIVKK